MSTPVDYLHSYREKEKEELEQNKQAWFKIFGLPDSRNYENTIYHSSVLNIHPKYWLILADLYKVSSFTVEYKRYVNYFHFGKTWFKQRAELLDRLNKLKEEIQFVENKLDKIPEYTSINLD